MQLLDKLGVLVVEKISQNVDFGLGAMNGAYLEARDDYNAGPPAGFERFAQPIDCIVIGYCYSAQSFISGGLHHLSRSPSAIGGRSVNMEVCKVFHINRLMHEASRVLRRNWCGCCGKA